MSHIKVHKQQWNLKIPKSLGRENPLDITAEFQGKYPSFKQNVAEKENIIFSIVEESQPLFDKYRLRETKFQKMTVRA